jgi:hypothetical protein
MEERERAESRRAAIAYLVWEQGGVAGAVRRLVYGWRGRFSSVQISIALQRRWPLLRPNRDQVRDSIEYLKGRRVVVCVLEKPTKLYQRDAGLKCKRTTKTTI